MPAPVPPAVVTLSFDPVVALGGLVLRWETLGIAGAVLVALVAGAIVAGRTPRVGGGGRLRRDDLLFVAVGATAGAVVGGRIGYLLLHIDYVAANPRAALDPGWGGFELSLGLVGGLAAGLAVATLLEGGTRRWAHAAARPIVLGLALGKAATALGGTGQGEPSNVTWATAYAGPGPWGSLAPSVPSHPSQLYEAAAYLVVALVLAAAASSATFRLRDGRLLALTLVLVGVVRFGVAFTWRDATVLGPLRAEQLIALVPIGLGLLAWPLAARADRRAGQAASVDDRAASWPEPGIADRWREPTGHR